MRILDIAEVNKMDKDTKENEITEIIKNDKGEIIAFIHGEIDINEIANFFIKTYK